MASKYIAGAHIDENGNIMGGKAGDQTGKEVGINTYYAYPWKFFLEPYSSKLGEEIANNSIRICNNDNIGYNQENRLSLYKEYKKTRSFTAIKNKCDCDCSSLVAACLIASGLKVDSNATTSTLYKEIMNTKKFKLVNKPSVRGTICLTPGKHTEIYLSTRKTDKPVAAKTTTSKIYYPSFLGTSIVDGLKSINVNSSFAYRYKIAKANGINGYLGTAKQNEKLLSLAKNGKLKKC